MITFESDVMEAPFKKRENSPKNVAINSEKGLIH